MQRVEYERHLPHQIPPGAPIFATWNLKGALRREVIERMRHERKRLEREPRRKGESLHDRRVRHSKVIFAMTDRYCDQSRKGPLHLRDPAAAKCAEDAVLFGVPMRYELYAYVVMPNHVHILITPIKDYAKVMQGIKGYSARQINLLHRARGRVFWQDESYDHWPRDEEEFFRIIAYIENNPVNAGFCKEPQQWPWSSAALRTKLHWPLGEPLRRSGFPA
jgi:putative transposase